MDDQDTVDPALNSLDAYGSADSRSYAFRFRASDGLANATQTVSVRVFDVNRAPQIIAGNHAVAVGDSLSLSLPVVFGHDANNGIAIADPDGAAQTAALTIRFANLPEGAVYDPQTRRLTWTPGPGQIGDTVVTAQVFDGRSGPQASTSTTFVLRAVANAEANPPSIVVSTTPSLPANPGQLVTASVRADSWSGIARLFVELRSGESWQSVALDAAGRFRFTPDQPGLIDLRVTAIDRDGFTATSIHQRARQGPGRHPRATTRLERRARRPLQRSRCTRRWR
jgi:hypothetical protein